MHVAFGRVRRRIARLRTGTGLLLRNTRISEVYLLVVRRFIACLRQSYPFFVKATHVKGVPAWITVRNGGF